MREDVEKVHINGYNDINTDIDIYIYIYRFRVQNFCQTRSRRTQWYACTARCMGIHVDVHVCKE
jgi:hypothetical protein